MDGPLSIPCLDASHVPAIDCIGRFHARSVPIPLGPEAEIKTTISKLSLRWRGGSHLPGIRVKEGESFESALRRFKKKCEKAGILADLRRHQHFEKPSERRKRKMNAAKRKNMARRQQEI
jgi:small subunit ribosomal protein S21